MGQPDTLSPNTKTDFGHYGDGHPRRQEIPSLGSRTCNNSPLRQIDAGVHYNNHENPRLHALEFLSQSTEESGLGILATMPPRPSTTSDPTEFDILLGRNCQFCY